MKVSDSDGLVDINSVLDKYAELEKQIYDYFQFVEEWTVYPICDSREYFWCLTDYDVIFSDKEQNAQEMYSNEIIRNMIYEKDDCTMILVDTHTDGNKFLQIFDNSKKREFKDYECYE